MKKIVIVFKASMNQYRRADVLRSIATKLEDGITDGIIWKVDIDNKNQIMLATWDLVDNNEE